jgi:exopolyphosphatase/guanosine-5'-triphosphate,3'-diphosphate pyrophosphatase
MPHRALGERLGGDHALAPGEVLGAIDVGSNAARLKLARIKDDGSFDVVHLERDPIRPGEGIWQSGEMGEPVVRRLIATLQRYADVCRRLRVGHVRAVATSALREARNKDDVVRRIRERCGIELEVIPGKEEARLIGLGVFRGQPARARSLLIDIGGGSTEVVRGVGEEPVELYSVNIGAVRLTEIFGSTDHASREQLVAMRRFAQRVVEANLPTTLSHAPRHAIGSSGTVRAVCAFAAPAHQATVTREEMSRAVEELVRLGPAARRKRFDAQRADIVVAGAVILEAVLFHCGLESITPVDGGLKEGLLVDLVRRAHTRKADPLLSEAVIAAGRRFSFDEAHALHTRDVALMLFDQLEDVHHLPLDCRLLLEAAAVLHDIGYLVSTSRHHKHSQYLIANLDLPGLSERERTLVSLIARFHRRSLPTREHPALASLTLMERRAVRALSSVLRIADTADHGRRQPVERVETTITDRRVRVRFAPRRGRDIEAWDHDAERELFRSCFGRTLEVVVSRPTHIGIAGKSGTAKTKTPKAKTAKTKSAKTKAAKTKR